MCCMRECVSLMLDVTNTYATGHSVGDSICCNQGGAIANRELAVGQKDGTRTHCRS